MRAEHIMARRRKTNGTRRSLTLLTVHPYAAGIDIGLRFHGVAVSPALTPEPVRTSQRFTDDPQRMADWLVDLGITTVARESTGIYWIPAGEMREARGVEVLLVHARHVKNVPGRKTDVPDACWRQQLHQHGLLRGSFRPANGLAALRASRRPRARLLEYAAAHMQHMQKARLQMNVQLHHVVSDSTGGTGMKISRAIVAGRPDPATWAAYRDVRCKASVETVRQALTGNYRPEHVFALRQALELYDSYQAQVAECDQAIEAVLASLEQTAPETPLPVARHKTRAAWFQLLGTDLTQLHGFGAYTALMLVGECGTDMTKWPTVQHFPSWRT
jgi:hypothetical protein